MEFHSIVVGLMKSRGRDRYGDGQPGSSRDGGTRAHNGLDIVARPMQQIMSPVGGLVGGVSIQRRPFYTWNPRSGNRKVCGLGNKTLYVLGLFSGPVQAGGLVGHAQDLSSKYSGITNHVHLEVFRNGVRVDPREPFRRCF